MAKLSERHLFRADNTDGYSKDELDEPNERLEAAWEREQRSCKRRLDPDDEDKSLLDHLAERILADYEDWPPRAPGLRPWRADRERKDRHGHAENLRVP